MLRGLELLGSDQALRASASVLAAPGADARGRAVPIESVPPRRARRRTGDGLQVERRRRAGRGHSRGTARRQPESAGQWIAAGLNSDDADVRYTAVESGLALRIDQAWKTATQMATSARARGRPAI